MMDHLRRLGSTLESMITRGKVVSAQLGPRTLLNLTGLDGEAFDQVELLLPPGYCALPVADSDILILQANGVRNHKIAVAGDAIADRQADLQPGEVGISRNGQRVILRQGYVEMVSATAIRLTAPSLTWSPDGVTFYALATAAHIHPDPQGGETGVPVATAPGLTI